MRLVPRSERPKMEFLFGYHSAIAKYHNGKGRVDRLIYPIKTVKNLLDQYAKNWLNYTYDYSELSFKGVRMSEQVKDAGSIDGGAGGEADKTSQTVAYESHKKALDQMKARKESLRRMLNLQSLKVRNKAEEIKRLEEEKA